MRLHWGRNLMLCAAASWAASAAFGDGCFVWHGGVDLLEPTQKAILFFRDGTETLLLQVKYEGPASEFAWIVSLPTRPEVTAVDPGKNPFAEISLYTQQRARWELDGRGKVGDVEVLERKVVGVFDVAILAATDATALTDWLAKNGFAFPKNRADVLRSYVRKRWVYVAMRIDPRSLTSDNEQKLHRGELQPVRFRFPTKQAVYPLRISSLNAGRTEVLLYLLGDQPLVYAGGPTNTGFAVRASLPLLPQAAGDPDYGTFPKVNGAVLPLTWEALDLATNTALHLAKYRAVYASPEMTGDLSFKSITPVAFWRAHLQEAGKNLPQQQLALRCLAAKDKRYAPRLRLVEHQIQVARDKTMRELNDRRRVERAMSDSSADRVSAARDKDLPRDLIRRLARDSVPIVRATVAAREDIGALREEMAALARDADASVRLALAFNEQAPVTVRAPILLRDAEPSPKASLGYQSTNPALLAVLAGDTNTGVRMAVAHNPNTPSRILWPLATDQAKDVKLAAAQHRNAPVELVARMARDPDRFVRYGVAVHVQQLPAASLRALARDSDPDVRRAVARHVNTEADVLRALAADADPDVRSDVAQVHRVPAELLRQLAADSAPRVRAGVALNPHCPRELLRQLVQDPQEQVANLAHRALQDRRLLD